MAAVKDAEITLFEKAVERAVWREIRKAERNGREITAQDEGFLYEHIRLGTWKPWSITPRIELNSIESVPQEFHEPECECSICQTNDRLGYDADISDRSQYCKHGTFIGSAWGPDYLCGMCEDGYEPSEDWAMEKKRKARIKAVNKRTRIGATTLGQLAHLVINAANRADQAVEAFHGSNDKNRSRLTEQMEYEQTWYRATFAAYVGLLTEDQADWLRWVVNGDRTRKERVDREKSTESIVAGLVETGRLDEAQRVREALTPARRGRVDPMAYYQPRDDAGLMQIDQIQWLVRGGWYGPKWQDQFDELLIAGCLVEAFPKEGFTPFAQVLDGIEVDRLIQYIEIVEIGLGSSRTWTEYAELIGAEWKHGLPTLHIADPLDSIPDDAWSDLPDHTEPKLFHPSTDLAIIRNEARELIARWPRAIAVITFNSDPHDTEEYVGREFQG